MIKVEFKYSGENIEIESRSNETIGMACKRFTQKVKKDINKLTFIYSGNQLSLNTTINEIINNLDKQRGIMSVIVFEIIGNSINSSNDNNNKYVIKSEFIICPECKEPAKINLEHFKIKIYDCKNGHNTYLLFNEFENSQCIDESKILCQICNEKKKSNTYNKIMYFCNICNKNICPLCREKHDKNHILINYEQKYYVCERHNRTFSSFCNTCQKDNCVLCELEHANHEIIPYSRIIPKTDFLYNIFNQKIKKSIKDFNERIFLLVNQLNNIKTNLEIYIKIIESIIQNYSNNNNNINYKILRNLKVLDKFNEEEIIKNLKKINIENDNFVQNISNIYKKMNVNGDQSVLNNQSMYKKISNNNKKYYTVNMAYNEQRINNSAINKSGENNYIGQNSKNYLDNLKTLPNGSIQVNLSASSHPPQVANNSFQKAEKYLFPLKGLEKNGPTCHMNATLQCLLHVSELVSYFLEEFPKDQEMLLQKNKDVPSKGDISKAFYNLIKNVVNNGNIASVDEFKKSLGKHNFKFTNLGRNEPKELILYLLQSLHEEMNYKGDKNIEKNNYNPYDMNQTYNCCKNTYNSNNSSKISQLFYGTNIKTTTCSNCKYKLYNFQIFEFISFKVKNYHNKNFNIFNGFNDNFSPIKLVGNYQFYCHYCKKYQNCETICQIKDPPQKLLICIDNQGKYQPFTIQYSDIIDISKYVIGAGEQQIKYQILGICTLFGTLLCGGYYEAFCKNKETNIWYEFRDNYFNELKNKQRMKGGSPYLLLYERI